MLKKIKSEIMINNKSEKRFFNRELSWLKFNDRVLALASDDSLPLYERLNFLSISASNLDEFLNVRFAGLIGQYKSGVTEKSNDGLMPSDQVNFTNSEISSLIDKQYNIWSNIRNLLFKANVKI